MRKRTIAEQGLYLQQAKVQKPDVYGIRKRLVQKIESDDEFPIEDEILSLDSDTISAAEYLTGMNPSLPICILHQIYSILPNNTTVDRELVR